MSVVQIEVHEVDIVGDQKWIIDWEFPVLPRLDEYIHHEEEYYKVTGVVYDAKIGRITILVQKN